MLIIVLSLHHYFQIEYKLKSNSDINILTGTSIVSPSYQIGTS